jgi:hypothetical protein
LGVVCTLVLWTNSPLEAQQDTTVRDTTDTQDQHPQDSPEGRGFLLATPDGSASLRIRGSLRVNAALDFQGLQSQADFNTFEIPVGDANTTEPRFFMAANQTRVGLEVTRETTLGGAFLRLETDFRGTGNSPRLRHAYGTLGRLLVGQTWSTFGDVASLPLTVDLDGPNSSVAVRSVQVRYTWPVKETLRVAWSVEAPEPEVATSDTSVFRSSFQLTPDIALQVRGIDSEWGHVQIAGIFRTIRVKVNGANDQGVPAGGILVSAVVGASENETWYIQGVAGRGISRYITALQGQGLDVILNPATGKAETIGSVGGYLTYSRTWPRGVTTSLTPGIINLERKAFSAPGTFAWSGYVSLNAFWDPTPGTRLGVEYSWGSRTNTDNQSGVASRLSAIMYFDF